MLIRNCAVTTQAVSNSFRIVSLSLYSFATSCIFEQNRLCWKDVFCIFCHSWDSNHWCWDYKSNQLVPELSWTHLVFSPHLVMYYMKWMRMSYRQKRYCPTKRNKTKVYPNKRFFHDKIKDCRNSILFFSVRTLLYFCVIYDRL